MSEHESDRIRKLQWGRREAEKAAKAEEAAGDPDVTVGVSEEPIQTSDIGLSIDMLDADRLRHFAQNLLVYGPDITHWSSVPFVVSKLQTIATGIEKAVKDIGLLRLSSPEGTRGDRTHICGDPNDACDQECADKFYEAQERRASVPPAAPAATSEKSKAFKEGCKAWPAWKLIDNPYDERSETVESEAWKNGWLSVHFESLKVSSRVSAATPAPNSYGITPLDVINRLETENQRLKNEAKFDHEVTFGWYREQLSRAESRIRELEAGVSAATPAPQELVMNETEVPRRIDLSRWVPAEHAIYNAVQAVEAMSADIRLTDAVVLLQRARERVADFVDGVSAAERPAPTWQPIESAPIEKPVLVWIPAHESMPASAQRAIQTKGFFWYLASFQSMRGLSVHPTHWMDEPAPPGPVAENK